VRYNAGAFISRAQFIGIGNPPDVRAHLLELGGERTANSPQQFEALQKAQPEKWLCVIRDSGAKVN